VSVQLRFEPEGRLVHCGPGESLLASARRAGVRIASTCGGRGTCKSCAVQIIEGTPPEASPADHEFFSDHELAAGWRRACQSFPAADCVALVPARSHAAPLRTEVAGEDISAAPDPAVRGYKLALDPPDAGDAHADGERRVAGLNAKWPGLCHGVDGAVLRGLPGVLRANDWRVLAAVRFGEVVAVLPQKSPLVGLAVDLGTTNIGVFLVDLRTGRTLASRGVENPQTAHGGDLIARAGFARRTPDGGKVLRDLARGAINQAAAELCAGCGLTPEAITDIVVAGNMVMHHSLLGLPLDHLCAAPFVPVQRDALDIKARDCGLTAAPGACVHLLANIAGFIGGDHVAMLLAIGAEAQTGRVLALDIGTNTEVSLIHDGAISSVSCPSGPALEGGAISAGMRAAAGAIESVRIEGDDVILKTLEDAPPAGLCGSGVLEAVAALYGAGVIDARGRFAGSHPRQSGRLAGAAFHLSDGEPPVTFTQEDVRAVQLAKSAIRAGIAVLLARAGLAVADLDQIIIAGAFGNYIHLPGAIAIGLLPDVPLTRFVQVGNAAGVGARLALVSYPHRAEGRAIAARSRTIDLAGAPDFMPAFMKHMNFPPKE
jgi:uncharacterized 2Fe-2S/4Fe-4S cluster protein (DUF4445 family)